MSREATAHGEPPPPEEPTQCAALPYRESKGVAEVLLITPRGGEGWIIPKGKIEPGLGSCESARREAREEAGVEGEIDPVAFDLYRHGRGDDGPLVVVFLLRVTRELRSWPEAHQRDRIWVPIEAAAARIVDPGLARVLWEAGGRLEEVMTAAGLARHEARMATGATQRRRNAMRFGLALLAVIVLFGVGASILGR